MDLPTFSLLRHKQQLKKQLLYGVSTSMSQKVPKSAPLKQVPPMSPIIQEFHTHSRFVPAHKVEASENRIEEEGSKINQNASILDEFSRCPFKEDESLDLEEGILNNFYKNKGEYIRGNNRILEQKSDFITGQRSKCQKQYTDNLNQGDTNVNNKIGHEYSSKNIKQIHGKTPESEHSKNIWQFCSDVRQFPTQNHNNSNLSDLDPTSPLQPNKIQTKSITLSKTSKAKKTKLPEQKFIQKEANLTNPFEQQEKKHQKNQDEEDEKLEKVLKSRSSLKKLIMDKQQNSSYVNESREEQKKDQKLFEDLDTSGDLVKMLPNYESSTSGLDPVLQDELQDIEDSVRNSKNSSAIKSTKKYQPEQKQTKIIEPKPISINLFQGFKKQPDLFLKTNKSKVLESISVQQISMQEIADISEIHKMSSEKMFSDEKDIRRISQQLGEHQLSRQSIHNSMKNISKSKENADEESILSAYEESENSMQMSQKYNQRQNNQMEEMKRVSILSSCSEEEHKVEKIMIDDIKKDVLELKKRMENQLQGQESSKSDRMTNLRKARKQSYESGSSGPQNKSIMNFFQEYNNKLDMKQIQRDISGLRNKILSDSSYFQ